MGWCDGKVVWITGGGSGLGRAMALEFASHGAKVAVSGRRREKLQEVVAELERAGKIGLAVPCDCTDEEQIAASIATIVGTWGGLDIAVANAGFSVAGRVEELSADQLRKQFDVNVVGAAMTAKHAIPHLRTTKGRIALVGSVAGLAYFPGFAAYQCSKAAVLALGHTLSSELYSDGVSCTVLQPGFVKSEIGQIDNDGVFDPTKKDSRPAALLWETADAARVMVKAIERRDVEYTFTGHGKLGAFLGRHAPYVVRWVSTRTAFGRRMTEQRRKNKRGEDSA